MSRKGVEEVLNEQLRISSSFAPLDEFYKDFKAWQLCIRNDVKKLLSSKGNSNRFAMPTTPAASLRKRPRLSVITESPADTVQPVRKSLPRNSKNGKAKSQRAKKVRHNRIKLAFDVSDEEIDSTDDTKSIESVASSSKQFLNSCANISQLLKSNPSFDCGMKENVDESHNKEESNEKTTNNYKILNGSKRNTRSNARTSRNVGYEILESEDQYSVDASSSGAHTLLPEPIKEANDRIPAEEKESTTKRKGRSKNHSIIGHNKRFTASKRNTRSNARTSQNVESQGQYQVDVSPTVLHTSISESIVERIDPVPVEKKLSTLERKGNSECQSIVDNEKLFSTSKSAVASSNMDYQTSDRLAENIPEISNIAVSVNKNNLQEQFCKNLTISVVRIDETIENSQHPVIITEEILRKCSGNNMSVSSKRSSCKNSDDVEKISLEKNSLGEKRKRELSGLDIQRPSKKSNLHESDRENKDTVVVENDVQKRKTRSSLRPELLQNRGCTVFASPERKSRKLSRFSEVVSFSQLTSPISNKRASKNDIFENSIGSSEKDEEEEQEDNTNAKIESGKGNSTDSEVECRSKQRQSQRKKKAATKPNTPNTRGSRKGAHAALFSPYANEPVKNRVAAYETLSSVAEEIEIPVTAKRVTRTKTRAMAAAAAAAAAEAEASMLVQMNPKNNSSVKSDLAQKLSRASLYRAKKRLATAAKKNDASKENSFVSSAKNTGRTYNFNFQAGGKILADVNGLSTSQLNSSRKTPMTGQKLFVFNSANQSSKSAHKPGVILGNVDTFIKKNVKPVQDIEIKKIEEQKKREEKEREAQRRREELLKKQAEEKKKKRDEMRLRVQEKREAQEKEKQESQLRVGKEKNEKWNIIQQEREAKQKGNVLKKKLETERKAAEAKRKLEEAENARLAKLKMEELQHKKEQEEAEKERQRLLSEEKEAAFLREKVEQKMRVKPLAKVANEKSEIQKNTNVSKPQVDVTHINDSSATKPLDSTFTKPLDSTFPKPLDSTFTKPLDSTFTKPLDSTFTKPLDSTYSKPLDYSIFTKALNSSIVKTLNIPTIDKLKAGKKNNNAYNLEDLPSGDSEDETEDKPKKVARWAYRTELLRTAKLDECVDKTIDDYFCTPKSINFSEIFPNKRSLKRTSSAIWHTPPRYSCLPKY